MKTNKIYFEVKRTSRKGYKIWNSYYREEIAKESVDEANEIMNSIYK